MPLVFVALGEGVAGRSEIVGFQPRRFGKPCERPRTDLVLVVEANT
jgi:hypothetical protein